MSSFVVIRLSSDKFTFIPTSKGYKNVDLRPARIESVIEKNAALSSLKAFGLSCNDSMCTRFVTVVDSCDERSAVDKTISIFEETLNYLFLNWHGIEDMSLLPAGYTRNMATGEVRPILPKNKSHFPTFQIVAEKYPQIMMDQWLSYNVETSGLAKALTRSLHWRRLGTFEDKKELKFLFKWISIESLTKLNVDDDVIPKIMLAFGFPTSIYTKQMNRKFLRLLCANPDFKTWKTWLFKLFEEMRTYRNDVVHSGFRNIELSISKLVRFDKVLNIAVPRLQGLVEHGYRSGITDLKELWEYAPFIVESQTNKIKDVHGTVIYILNSELR